MSLLGDAVLLRARRAGDVPLLHAELYDDVVVQSRANFRAWRPISPDSAASPFAVAEPSDAAAIFSVVLKDSGEVAGEARLWGIDQYNRLAHLGISLRPSMRARGLGADIVRVLCHYGFTVLGLHRLQVDTLADNAAMIGAATKVGFVLEGTMRRAAWVTGEFLDEVVLGLLADEWVSRTGGDRRSSSGSGS